MRKKNQSESFASLDADYRKSGKRTAILTLVVALALALIAGPLLAAKPSAAILDHGGFCIQAKGFEGEFTGMAGAKSCGTAEQPEQPDEPEIPAPVPAAIAQPCFVGGGFNARTITLKWRATDADSYEIEYAKQVDGQMVSLPSGVVADTSGSPSDYTTVISGTAVIPANAPATYAVRLTDGDRASKWVLMTATAPFVGATTCTIDVG